MSDKESPEIHRSDTVTSRSSDDSSGTASLQGVQQLSPTESPPGSSITTSRPRASTSGSAGTGRRRKVPDSVTPNACTNCKKARAKCDGARPACKRCNNRAIQDTCHYELHAKTAKEQMIREIQRLQRKNESLEDEKDTLGEKNEWIEQIMQSLKADGQSYEIINRLKRGESHQAIAAWLGRPLVGDQGTTDPLSPTMERQITEAIHRYHKRFVEEKDPSFWTSVTQDGQLIEHLVNLYLSWIHPVHMLFDQERFWTSFRNCEDVYCAPNLVSAICAMSCHLLHSINTDENTDIKGAVDGLHNRFLNEARFILRSADPGKMTTVQTYAVIFLAELGAAQGIRGAPHLRLATEMLVDKQIAEQSAEAESVSAWGILTLNTAWAAFSYQKPNAPVSTQAEPFATEIPHYANGVWRQHKQPGDTETTARRGFAIMTASQHAKLFRVVHELILVYCGSRGRVGAHHLLDLYKRFMTWRSEVPPELLDDSEEPLPHVLFLHIQYHTALIQLLQPILHTRHLSPTAHTTLTSILLQHARAGLHLLIRHRDVHSIPYLSPLQLLCLVQICDVLVRYEPNPTTTTQTIHFCLASLQDAKQGYALAGPLQKMFRQSLADYNIPVPEEMERMMGAAAQLGPEDLLDACTRVGYSVPINQLLPNMDPGLAEEFVKGWRGLEERERPESQTPPAAFGAQRVEIGSLLNP